ncbi:cell wall-binding repeat-containing protein [Dehalobacter sp. 14DCB1]|uniref:cell wall-binding repeat-containing protein n=1 Tax=Dehalobacter sp. 14DCB1 TaxID=2070227 RepID=UPI001048A67E|nr:cell wall-binding repeat-containing protein [Dehalobacter sp. 14DCB1]TCX48922.1 cell wall-binding repeat-containing protein [Dehalobacter sp. 14DCB1]
MRKMTFGIKGILSIVLLMVVFTIPVLASTNSPERIYGADRYKTAEAIANTVNSNQIDCVVLAPGNSYANALPASVLAYKNNAPLLLINSTASNTVEAFDYLKSHLSSTGKIYLVGDSTLIRNDFITRLNGMGYTNIIKISGFDIYNTDYLIAKELNVSSNTPMVISSGINFPDALAISSVASSNGWPILLTDGTTLSNDIKSIITEKQPQKIYITGGAAAVANSIEDQIKSIAPNSTIIRFAGSDRYETSTLIADQFFSSSENIYLASGLDYPDALAGSVLAAQNQSSIILINPNTKRSIPVSVVHHMVELREKQVEKNLIALGGITVVPDEVIQLANDVIGNISLTSLGQPVNFSYAFTTDPKFSHNGNFVEGTGSLSEEQEMALITAVNFYNSWKSINYQNLDNISFGYEYCSDRFADGEKQNLVNTKSSLIQRKYVHQINKITLSSYGTAYILKDTPYTFFRIAADVQGYDANTGGSFHGTEYQMILLYNVRGYWEIDSIR